MPFRFFQTLFFISLFLFPVLLGSVNLWAFSLGALVLCAALAAYWFFFRPSRDPEVTRTDLDGWIGVYLVFFLVSLALSKVPYLSWIEFFKLAVVLCAFWATRFFCRARPQIYRLSQGFVFLGGALSAVGLLQFAGGIPHPWWSQPHFLSSTYVNHNHFAGLLVLVLPISFGLALAERDRSKKILYFFLTALMGVAFVFTLSRGALAALLASMAWMLWLLKKRHMVRSSLPPFLILVLLVAGAVVVFGMQSIEQRIENIQSMSQSEELSLKFRWWTWQGTLSMIRDFFWWGSGPGTFGHLFLSFRPVGFSMRPAYTLNDFLQLWAECGVFSFLAVTALTLAFFYHGSRIIRFDESRLRIGVGSGVMAGTLGLLLHGMTDFNFHIPANWLLSAVAAGLLFSMDERRVYRSGRMLGALKTAIPSVILAVSASAVYLGLYDYRLWEAKAFLREGERGLAVESAEACSRMNPWDAEPWYLRGFVRLLDKKEAAVEALEEAIRLNPYEPVYDLAKARALAGRLAVESPEALATLFGRAADKDPKNPSIAFMAAKEMLSADRARAGVLREAAERLLLRAVRLDPSFSEKAFQVLWGHDRKISKLRDFYEKAPGSLEGFVLFMERRGLWRFHRPYHLKLLGIDPDAVLSSVSKGSYEGSGEAFTLKEFAHTGKKSPNYNELFFTNGEVFRKIVVHNSLVLIKLRLKGSAENYVYPTLYVKIDGKVVDERYVDNSVYGDHITAVRCDPGHHLLSLEYVNDFSAKGSGKKKEDRNLWVQRIELQGAELADA